MAILEHRANHNLEPKDFIDFTGADKNFKGSMIGMFVGILGGPLDILLGWFTGSLIGSSKDVKEVQNAMSIFEQSLVIFPEGETGLTLIYEGANTGHIERIDKRMVEGHARKRCFRK